MKYTTAIVFVFAIIVGSIALIERADSQTEDSATFIMKPASPLVGSISSAEANRVWALTSNGVILFCVAKEVSATKVQCFDRNGTYEGNY